MYVYISTMVWVLKHCKARSGRPNQEDFKLGGPRCCCTVPGSGHQTGPSGLRAIQVIQSRAAVSVPRGIGLTEALARAGRPSQEDFKLGSPRRCCTVTVPGRGHRAVTGPLGRRPRAGSDSLKHWRVLAVPVRKNSSWAAPAAVAPYRRAAATVPGRTHPGRSNGACGSPSQKDFKWFAGPRACHWLPVGPWATARARPAQRLGLTCKVLNQRSDIPPTLG